VVLPWLLTAALLFAFWLLLVDTREEAQIYAGIAIALLGAAGSELVRAQRIAQVRPRWRMLRRAWRPLASVPRDVGLLAAALWSAFRGRRPRGRLRSLTFEPGGEDGVDNARRAAAEFAGSFSPNTVVVGIDRRRKAILVHQLVPDDEDPESSIDPLGVRRREPGAGA
jgi:multisubunit Na+/H+ antiporter MnhE subunit